MDGVADFGLCLLPAETNPALVPTSAEAGVAGVLSKDVPLVAGAASILLVVSATFVEFPGEGWDGVADLLLQKVVQLKRLSFGSATSS